LSSPAVEASKTWRWLTWIVVGILIFCSILGESTEEVDWAKSPGNMALSLLRKVSLLLASSS